MLFFTEAEILALEIKLQAIEKKQCDKKDVSLQVTFGTNKKNQSECLIFFAIIFKIKNF